jgi:steroid 5-alpha reductase family enzyme
MVDDLTGLALLWRSGAFALVVFVLVLWPISLRLRDASIVDIFWGPGGAAMAWIYYISTPSPGLRALICLILVTAWGLRLGLYIGRRNHAGEDPRYAAIRAEVTARGGNFTLYSLRVVFIYQGLAMMAGSLPALFAITGTSPGLGILGWLGAIIAASGLAIEATADQQMSRFRATRKSRDEVMDRGLWRYSRHPNYCGEIMMQWGLLLLALDTGPWALLAIIGPAMLTYLIIGPMGAGLLEKRLGTNPAYDSYVRRTSAILLWPPSK